MSSKAKVFILLRELDAFSEKQLPGFVIVLMIQMGIKGKKQNGQIDKAGK